MSTIAGLFFGRVQMESLDNILTEAGVDERFLYLKDDKGKKVANRDNDIAMLSQSYDKIRDDILRDYNAGQLKGEKLSKHATYLEGMKDQITKAFDKYNKAIKDDLSEKDISATYKAQLEQELENKKAAMVKAIDDEIALYKKLAAWANQVNLNQNKALFLKDKYDYTPFSSNDSGTKRKRPYSLEALEEIASATDHIIEANKEETTHDMVDSYGGKYEINPVTRTLEFIRYDNNKTKLCINAEIKGDTISVSAEMFEFSASKPGKKGKKREIMAERDRELAYLRCIDKWISLATEPKYKLSVDSFPPQHFKKAIMYFTNSRPLSDLKSTKMKPDGIFKAIDEIVKNNIPRKNLLAYLNASPYDLELLQNQIANGGRPLPNPNLNQETTVRINRLYQMHEMLKDSGLAHLKGNNALQHAIKNMHPNQYNFFSKAALNYYEKQGLAKNRGRFKPKYITPEHEVEAPRGTASAYKKPDETPNESFAGLSLEKQKLYLPRNTYELLDRIFHNAWIPLARKIELFKSLPEKNLAAQQQKILAEVDGHPYYLAQLFNAIEPGKQRSVFWSLNKDRQQAIFPYLDDAQKKAYAAELPYLKKLEQYLNEPQAHIALKNQSETAAGLLSELESNCEKEELFADDIKKKEAELRTLEQELVNVKNRLDKNDDETLTDEAKKELEAKSAIKQVELGQKQEELDKLKKELDEYHEKIEDNLTTLFNRTTCTLSIFSPEEVKKLQKLVGDKCPALESLDPTKYKETPFTPHDLKAISKALAANGNTDAKKLLFKLATTYTTAGLVLDQLLRLYSPHLNEQIIKSLQDGDIGPNLMTRLVESLSEDARRELISALKVADYGIILTLLEQSYSVDFIKEMSQYLDRTILEEISKHPDFKTLPKAKIKAFFAGIALSGDSQRQQLQQELFEKLDYDKEGPTDSKQPKRLAFGQLTPTRQHAHGKKLIENYQVALDYSQKPEERERIKALNLEDLKKDKALVETPLQTQPASEEHYQAYLKKCKDMLEIYKKILGDSEEFKKKKGEVDNVRASNSNPFDNDKIKRLEALKLEKTIKPVLDKLISYHEHKVFEKSATEYMDELETICCPNMSAKAAEDIIQSAQQKLKDQKVHELYNKFSDSVKLAVFKDLPESIQATVLKTCTPAKTIALLVKLPDAQQKTLVTDETKIPDAVYHQFIQAIHADKDKAPDAKKSLLQELNKKRSFADQSPFNSSTFDHYDLKGTKASLNRSGMR